MDRQRDEPMGRQTDRQTNQPTNQGRMQGRTYPGPIGLTQSLKVQKYSLKNF